MKVVFFKATLLLFPFPCNGFLFEISPKALLLVLGVMDDTVAFVVLSEVTKVAFSLFDRKEFVCFENVVVLGANMVSCSV